MSNYINTQQATDALFDEKEIQPQTLQEIWQDKIIQVTSDHKKKQYRGIIFIGTIADDEHLNGYYYHHDINTKKSIQIFLNLKYQGLVIIGCAQETQKTLRA